MQALRGPGAAGLNRAVWNLAESSSCPPVTDSAEAGRGRGRGRGGRGGGGTWVRAIPGEYTVQLAAAGQTQQQPLTVRPDPRIKTTSEDMQAWLTAARTIERTECSLDRAAAELSGIERRLSEMESRGGATATKAQIDEVRRELRPIVLALRGDSRDPGHVNLPGRINWLTIQVGNYSGRPTAAQMEWIATYAKQAESVIAALDGVKAKIK